MRDLRTGFSPRAAVAAALLLSTAFTVSVDAKSEERPPRGEGPLAELGRRLFFEPAASRSGRRSCATCHDPARAFSVPERSSDDDMGPSRRRSASLVDAYLAPSFHTDGEFPTVEALVEARIGFVEGARRTRYDAPSFPSPALPVGVSPTRLPDPFDDDRAFGTHPLDLNLLPDVATTLGDAGRYAEAFEAAFGTRDVTKERIATAIAAFTRTIRSSAAPVDRFLAGDASALGAAAARGLELFRGRAGCVRCHAMEPGRPTFSDQKFHVTGVAVRTARRDAERGRRISVDADPNVDPGRAGVTTVGSDRRAFRTPTLRDVALRGPFMHDGSFSTLEDVVRHYADGGGPDERLDPRVRGFDASPRDVQDLVAFLHALTSERRPGLAPLAWRVRPERQRVVLLDAKGRPLPAWTVTLEAEGDALPGPAAPSRRAATTDAYGTFEVPVSPRTHWRLRLRDGLEPLGGPLLPDTCAAAILVVPVEGRARVLVDLAREDDPPRSIDAVHEAALRLPTDPPTRTRLDYAGAVRVGDRQRVLYEGWARTDFPREVAISLPGDSPGTARTMRLGAGDPAVLPVARTRKVAARPTIGQVMRLDPRASGRPDLPTHVPLIPRFDSGSVR